MSEAAYIGVDLGGTKIRGLLMEENGSQVLSVTMPTPSDRSPEAVFGAIQSLISRLCRRSSDSRLTVGAVGVTVPGPFDTERDLSQVSPNLGWRNLSVRTYLEGEPLPVFFDNDASCAALAEMTAGAARGVRNFIYTTVSTGVGSRVVVNGRILRGVSYAAGETGHIVLRKNGLRCGCGNRGCLETLASGPAIARKVIQGVRRGRNSLALELARGRIESIDSRIVAQAARRGDGVCRQAFEEAGRYLGMAMACAVNIINPELVVMGGGVVEAGRILLDPMEDQLNRLIMPALRATVRVVRAELGNRAPAIGAAQMARQRITRHGVDDQR